MLLKLWLFLLLWLFFLLSIYSFYYHIMCTFVFFFFCFSWVQMVGLVNKNRWSNASKQFCQDEFKRNAFDILSVARKYLFFEWDFFFSFLVQSIKRTKFSITKENKSRKSFKRKTLKMKLKQWLLLMMMLNKRELEAKQQKSRALHKSIISLKLDVLISWRTWFIYNRCEEWNKRKMKKKKKKKTMRREKIKSR